jgi:hypothetical protein
MIDNVFISNRWKKGLGTQICALAGLYHYNIKKIVFEETSIEYKNFLTLVEYFNLTDIDITVGVNERDYFTLNPDDFFKIDAPYIAKPLIEKKANYIAIAMYNDNYIMEKELVDYPYYKQYTFDKYQQIIRQIKSIGYDIITIDSRDNDLLTKLNVLDNFAAALITYEGGIAHLAHCLNVPTIMIPWRIRQNDYLEELLHLDSRTYFLSNLEEFFTFDKERFESTINDLKLKKGNNRFVNNQINLKTKRGKYFVNKTEINLVFNKTEHEFFSIIRKNNSR